MATLKDHQRAMVDLLASGSGIPASASRLAHAMHDVLAHMVGGGFIMDKNIYVVGEVNDATTPGLNDKALAGDIEACRRKATPAERRVKELENTVKQLRASNAKLREERDELLRQRAGNYSEPEQVGCRKPDTQICVKVSDHDFAVDTGLCVYCGKHYREVTK
ncbi:hypothetical protein HVC90_004687 [Salmonella enterica]|nr:hypothetical protein [Salmonella enterica]